MFYMVFRIYKTDKYYNSVEYFNAADYDNQDDCVRAAEARFHNIITADLNNPDVTYQMAFILDNAGQYVERACIFNRA